MSRSLVVAWLTVTVSFTSGFHLNGCFRHYKTFSVSNLRHEHYPHVYYESRNDSDLHHNNLASVLRLHFVWRREQWRWCWNKQFILHSACYTDTCHKGHISAECSRMSGDRVNFYCLIFRLLVCSLSDPVNSSQHLGANWFASPDQVSLRWEVVLEGNEKGANETYIFLIRKRNRHPIKFYFHDSGPTKTKYLNVSS